MLGIRFSPQGGAILGADFSGIRRAIWSNAGVATAVCALVLVGPIVFSGFFAAFDPASGGGRFFAAVAGAFAASTMLGSVSGLGLATRTRPLLVSIPIQPRAVWEVFAGRVAFSSFVVALSLLLVAAAGSVQLVHAAAVSGFLFLANCGLGCLLLVLGSKYCALVTAGSSRALRWALWTTLAAFAAAPLVALVLTGDAAFSGRFAGPGFAVIELGREAAAGGASGALGFGALCIAACLALSRARLPARALFPKHRFPEEGIALPFPLSPMQERFGILTESYRAATDGSTRVGQMYVRPDWSNLGAPLDNDHEPLKLPERRAEALDFLGREGFTRGDLWALVIGLVAIVGLAAFTVFFFSQPRPVGGGGGVPTHVGALQLLAGAWLFFLAAVAVAVSPGFATRERIKAKAKMDGEAKPKRKKAARRGAYRPRPTPAVTRAWPYLQSLPVSREEMAHAFFPRQRELIAAGAAVVGLAAVAYVGMRPDSTTVAFILVGALSLMGLLGFVTVPFFMSAYVQADRRRALILLRMAIVWAWAIASLALGFSALDAIRRAAAGFPLNSGQVVAIAGSVGLGAVTPFLLWRAAALRLVVSQRPYETPTYFAVLGGMSALAFLAAVYALIGP